MLSIYDLGHKKKSHEIRAI